MATEERTKQILTELPLEAFANGAICHMKNPAASPSKFGYMEIPDLLASRWKIFIKKSELHEEFDSLDELVAAGWLVD